MSYSPFTATGNGSTTAYVISFPYVNTADVKATINEVTTTAFSVSGSTVTFNSAPPSGQAIKIFRSTDNETIEANFQSGSALRAVDLNSNFTQVLYVTQEANTNSGDALTEAAIATTNATAAATAATNAQTAATAAQTSATTAQTSATAAQTSATSAATNAATAANVSEGFTATGSPATALSVDVPLTAANGLKLPDQTDSYDTEGGIRYNTTSDVVQVRTGSGWSSITPTDAEIKTSYESNSNTNAFTDAEKSKLTAIEASATADQTGAEIKTLYEAESNAFTDAQFTKLAGIETSATADQTGAEIKTAYEAESNTNAFTDAEKTKLTGIETGATSDQTAAEIRTLVNSASDSNVFTDADHTKLNSLSVGSSINIGTSAPGSPAAGDLWYDSDVGRTYIYYNDGDSSQWVDSSPNANAADIVDGSVTPAKLSTGGPSWNTSTVLIGTTTASPFSNRPLSVGDASNQNGSYLEIRNGAQSGVVFSDSTASDNSGYRGSIEYDHTSDYLFFRSAGTERMRIDSSGNVSIGISTINLPSGKGLQVYDSSSPRIKLANSTTGTGIGDGSLLYLSGSDLLIDNKESANMRFYTSATERMRILSDGTIGAGVTSTPGTVAAGSIINGNANAGFFTSGYDGKFGTATNHPLYLQVNGSTKLGILADGAATFAGNIEVQKSAGTITAASSADSKFAALYAGNSSNDSAVLWQNGALRFYNTSERMRIDSSGSVLIGGSVVQAHANMDDLQLGDGNGNRGITISSGTSAFGSVAFGDSTDGAGTDRYSGTIEYYHGDNSMRFVTVAAEKMRIDSSGNIGIGNTNPSQKLAVSGSASFASGSFLIEGSSNAYTAGNFVGDSTGAFDGSNNKYVLNPTSGTATFGAYNSGSTSGYGALINITANAGQVFTQIISTGSQYTDMLNVYFGATKTFHALANGNVQNTNNSYGAISDIKLKENIVDASSQWQDIKNIRVRNYNFIEGQTHTQIGVVAQEVETVSPGLVNDLPDRDSAGNELETTTKAVNYSVLYMKAVKALQEAMERIETLETKVLNLEGAN